VTIESSPLGPVCTQQDSAGICLPACDANSCESGLECTDGSCIPTESLSGDVGFTDVVDEPVDSDVADEPDSPVDTEQPDEVDNPDETTADESTPDETTADETTADETGDETSADQTDPDGEEDLAVDLNVDLNDIVFRYVLVIDTSDEAGETGTAGFDLNAFVRTTDATPSFATSVVSFAAGTGDISSANDPDLVLGEPRGCITPETATLSLGVGGRVVVEMDADFNWGHTIRVWGCADDSSAFEAWVGDNPDPDSGFWWTCKSDGASDGGDCTVQR